MECARQSNRHGISGRLYPIDKQAYPRWKSCSTHKRPHVYRKTASKRNLNLRNLTKVIGVFGMKCHSVKDRITQK